MKNPLDLILGFFDGLHIGHKLLIDQTFNNPFNVLTFQNIPNKKNNFLYSFEERKNQLRIQGAKQIFCMDIAKNNMTAEEFCKKLLSNFIPFKKIIVGSDYLFGSDQKNVIFLKSFINDITIVDRSSISTSKIKKLVGENNFSELNKLLLEPYYRTGKVVSGYGHGKKLGFPTANIPIEPNLISLSEGSYATKIVIGNKTYLGVTFVGKSKTLLKQNSFIETHIINFHGNLYGQIIKIIFYKFLRTNVKFSSLDLLKKAIQNDLNQSFNFFQNLN
ncbi:riboflavin biosynthesis protein RibF [Mycoplasmoides alvi]|uniref:riboflavin biosynthesis protein RibF n=1 Tax=Mycoplasmoides alvi TaxID=78580 RepID=UPI0006966176|nr:riboflavin biosynthesis protein RibF [Mycoplasmoides alvi]